VVGVHLLGLVSPILISLEIIHSTSGVKVAVRVEILFLTLLSSVKISEGVYPKIL
jgi:hypothetical protein